MRFASLVAACLALLCSLGGMVLAGVPVAGTVLAFAAPVVALGGLIVGGIAWSQARTAGVPAGLPIAGCILSAVVFLPSLVIALTCGLCNAFYSASMLDAANGSKVLKDLDVSFGSGDVNTRDAALDELEKLLDVPPLAEEAADEAGQDAAAAEEAPVEEGAAATP